MFAAAQYLVLIRYSAPKVLAFLVAPMCWWPLSIRLHDIPRHQRLEWTHIPNHKRAPDLSNTCTQCNFAVASVLAPVLGCRYRSEYWNATTRRPRFAVENPAFKRAVCTVQVPSSLAGLRVQAHGPPPRHRLTWRRLQLTLLTASTGRTQQGTCSIREQASWQAGRRTSPPRMLPQVRSWSLPGPSPPPPEREIKNRALLDGSGTQGIWKLPRHPALGCSVDTPALWAQLLLCWYIETWYTDTR